MFLAAYLLPVLFGNDGLQQMPDELRFSAVSLAALVVVWLIFFVGKLIEVPASIDGERLAGIKEKVDQLQVLQQTFPVLVCWHVNQGGTGQLLLVRNDGADCEVETRILVRGGGLVEAMPIPTWALWPEDPGRWVRLARGDKRLIAIATASRSWGPDGNRVLWTFPAVTASGENVFYETPTIELDSEDEPELNLTVTLTILTKPGMLGGPLVREFQVTNGDFAEVPPPASEVA